MSEEKILFIFGTRPEAIKLAPLILYFKKEISFIPIKVCLTGQHRDMLDDVLNFFSIVPDYDLDLMKPNQQLNLLTGAILAGLDEVLTDCQPTLVIVQGDTTTAMSGALSAFHRKIKVAHVEAGLRSYELYEPFPEEVNRRLISQIANLNFAPTKNSYENLVRENVKGKIFITGNTVIDALLCGRAKVEKNSSSYQKDFSFLNLNSHKRYLLVTIHRRENFGEPVKDICKAISEIANLYDDVEFIIPVHPNPNVKSILENIFIGNKKVHLLPPLSYDQLIWVMMHAYFVITDSGGIQEEAPSLGKPVLVLRNVTERMEGVECGTALLVGNQYENVFSNIRLLLDSESKYKEMSKAENPYGKGDSSKIIGDIILKEINGK